MRSRRRIGTRSPLEATFIISHTPYVRPPFVVLLFSVFFFLSEKISDKMKLHAIIRQAFRDRRTQCERRRTMPLTDDAVHNNTVSFVSAVSRAPDKRPEICLAEQSDAFEPVEKGKPNCGQFGWRCLSRDSNSFVNPRREVISTGCVCECVCVCVCVRHASRNVIERSARTCVKSPRVR